MGAPVTRRVLLPFAFLLAALLAAAGCGQPSPMDFGIHNRFAGPTRMAIAQNFLDPYGPLLFVANNAGGTITVINAKKYIVLSAHASNEDDLDVVRVGRAPYDVALTPDGTRLFVTDAWLDHVRTVEGWAGRRPDVFDAYVEIDPEGVPLLKYDIAIRDVPLMVRAGEIAIQSAPAPDGRSVPVYVTDPDNDRVAVIDSATGEIYDEAILPGAPTHIAITRAGDRLFITGRDGELWFIDGTSNTLLAGETIGLGGDPGRMTVSKPEDELYIVNADPPQIHIVSLSRPPRLLDNEVLFPTSPNNLASANDGRYVYVSGDDGYIYVFDTDTRRICDSWGGRVFFTDFWPVSNPALERIEVKDCAVRSEQWELVYHIEEDEWTVNGTQSGLQSGRAKSNQFYRTDDGALGFFIRENDLHSSDGDTIYFETSVGIAPIRVGLVPNALAVIPYYLNPIEDIIFIANTGSHNLSILFTEEFKRIGVIN